MLFEDRFEAGRQLARQGLEIEASDREFKCPALRKIDWQSQRPCFR